jgi:hypothetical protein
MSQNSQIAEFLEARIAEDEALALNAQHHDAKVPGVWVTEHHNSEYHDQPNSAHIAEDRAGHYWTVASEVFIPNAEHIARHDPARVLAECAAKRVILRNANYTALNALAAVHADHPDYRKDWDA